MLATLGMVAASAVMSATSEAGGLKLGWTSTI